MILKKPKCPKCGALAVGMVETVRCFASLTSPDENGCVEYAGDTKVDWDSQTPVTSGTKIILGCSNYHQWLSGVKY